MNPLPIVVKESIVLIFFPDAPTFSSDFRDTIIIRKNMQKIGKIFKTLLTISTSTFFNFE